MKTPSSLLATQHWGAAEDVVRNGNKERPQREKLFSVYHDSFARRSDAAHAYVPPTEFPGGHMPDEVTRSCARAMHYAAHRHNVAKSEPLRKHWKEIYLQQRNAILLGNRKLVYKIIRSQPRFNSREYDLASEGDFILMHAIARFNPWLGVRFSTYACTCIIRGFIRAVNTQIQREIREQPLVESAVPQKEASTIANIRTEAAEEIVRLLKPGHPLLTNREKLFLRLRFGLGNRQTALKLKDIGAKIGLKRERLRQIQGDALLKLRDALGVETQDAPPLGSLRASLPE